MVSVNKILMESPQLERELVIIARYCIDIVMKQKQIAFSPCSVD